MNSYKLSDLYIGLKESFQVSVTEKMMRHFLLISGDDNPLHVDVEFAKSRGFDKKVVYGMLSSAFYSRLVGVYLPGKYCLLQGVDISFKKPVFPGETLTVEGEVSYLNEAYKQIEIKANIKKSDGTVVSKAKIKTGLLDD